MNKSKANFVFGTCLFQQAMGTNNKTGFGLCFLLLVALVVLPQNLWAQDQATAADRNETVLTAMPVESENIPAATGLFSGTSFSGYVNAGFLMNTRGASWNGNASTGSHNGGGLKGLYVSAVKKAQTCKAGGDWGFGTDFLFGEDSRMCRVYNGFDESWWTGRDGRGNPWYGFAMPQLYTEFAVHHWTVQVGHFYTPLGYEPIPASGRFFFSSGLSYDSLPSTHTGGQLKYDGIENFEASVGWVNGNDEGFSDKTGGSLVLGFFKYKFSDKMSLAYGFTAGDYSDSRLDHVLPYHVYGSTHTWVLETSLNPCLDLATTADWQKRDGDFHSTTTTFGQYIYRRLNDHWRVGIRAEWQRFEYLSARDNELVNVTLGVNWAPTGDEKIFRIRPEVRYDSNTADPYGRHTNKPDQLCFGGDMIYQF
ncbi:MAG: outer membrane beta-barrel protein [Thermoguttaceae bacterium]|nr:outer membrane beta-barrel protein [Thermoguttaceae bacterium]